MSSLHQTSSRFTVIQQTPHRPPLPAEGNASTGGMTAEGAGAGRRPRPSFGPSAALLAAAALALPSAARCVELDQFIGLGDSTIDTGYFRYNPMGNPSVDQSVAQAVARGAQGGWAGNGVMATSILAAKFGLSAAPSGGGGTNYANGASYTLTDQQPLPGSVSTTRQIENYLNAVGGAANSDALYLISSGNNDLINANPSPNDLSDSAAALAAQVARLQAAGARTILVPNSFMYAVFAGLGGELDPSNAEIYARTQWYGRERWSDLTAAGVRFIPADLDSVFRYLVKHPTLFGFTASSVLSANAPSSVSALLSILTPEQHQSFLFIDGHHLTTAGQTIEADYLYSLLAAPSQISLLAESAVQSGLMRVASIQGQIERSARHRGKTALNTWASAAVDHLSIDNARGLPDASGTPFGGTMGADYLTPGGLLLGAALTVGGQSLAFSTGGRVEQMDETLSLYAAARIGPLWGNTVASYGFLQNDLERQVALGRFLDRNRADTDGQSLALALRGGFDATLGSLTTGPVAGVLLQRVRLDGFSESGTSGVTALRFDDQTRDSAISQLGWRGALDRGPWQPFAEVSWNHEWADDDRSITASLTSTAAPSYEADAVSTSIDWASASVGTSYAVNSALSLRATLSAMLFNPEDSQYGGALSLSVAF